MSDLISREDAIDAVADYIHRVDRVIGSGTLSADDCKDVARIVLEELPSAEHWIPCSERLPSRGVPVLVSGIMEDAPPITISTDAPLYYKEGWINAWMPLPEPYERRTE